MEVAAIRGIIGNEGNGQSGYLAFSPNNEKVRILATGRTGIGTTNPESILNLFGQGGTTSAITNSENVGATLVINDSGSSKTTVVALDLEISKV